MTGECKYFGSGGGGDTNIVTAYENGEWQNGFSASDFSFYNTTQVDDYLTNTTSNAGLVLKTDYSNDYEMMFFKFIPITPHDQRILQIGICELNATLPSITQSGTGRGTYYAYATKTMANRWQVFGAPLDSGKGAFLGAAPNGEAVAKIYGIYFVKKSS